MNVLFVSEKDECRGPMARILSQLHARDMGVVNSGFDSAGIDVRAPVLSPPEVVEFMKEQGLNIARHRSRPIASAQIRWADIVMCLNRSIADRVRVLLGPLQAGIVVVLNDAVKFGKTADERNVDALSAYNQRQLLTTFTRIKAATGRMVRNISAGEDTPMEFGAVAMAPAVRNAAAFIDDPQVRQFLSRYILEFIERAFEFPQNDDILEALAVMGRPLSILDLEELIREDLAGQVYQEEDGRWRIEESAREDRERQRRERVEQQRRREEEEDREQTRQQRAWSESGREGQRQNGYANGYQNGNGFQNGNNNGNGNGAGDEDSGRITQAQALEVLTITLDTTRDEAARKYKQLLMRFHPDRFHDDDEFRHMAERKTKRINLAWATVKDKLPDEKDRTPEEKYRTPEE